MKPLQQYFHMVLFIWYIVLTFESVDEIPSCYHSNETSGRIFAEYYFVHVFLYIGYYLE